jgi:hypothetical protein
VPREFLDVEDDNGEKSQDGKGDRDRSDGGGA